MPKYKLPVKEGDGFCVPLPGGGYGLGIVARERNGILLGYFFKPRLFEVPSIEYLSRFRPDGAFLKARFGYLGFKLDNWPVIGRYPNWIHEEWPVPVFGRIDLTDPERSVKVIYDDLRIDSLGTDSAVGYEAAASLPKDGLHGHISIANHLDLKIDE